MTLPETPAARKTAAAIEGRRADTARRRERVLAALSQAHSSGLEISVATIARTACVDRTFLYRHRDLLAQLHTIQAQPSHDSTQGAAVSLASLHTDFLAAHERGNRLATHIRTLERRLSQTLGEHVWRESGLGAPQDLDELNHRITALEQQSLDLRLQLEERNQDLNASRAANRELMTRLNTAK
ncbi:hypothetical protein [Arthrobacter sp. UYCu723]